MAQNQRIEPQETAHNQNQSSDKNEPSNLGSKRILRKPIKIDLLKDPRFRIAGGWGLMIFAAWMFIAFFSYLFTGQSDQSLQGSEQFGTLAEVGAETQNVSGAAGASLAYLLIFKWFGIGTILFAPILGAYGYQIVFHKIVPFLRRIAKFVIFVVLWLSVLLGFVVIKSDRVTGLDFLCGGWGFEIAFFLDYAVGVGTVLCLLLSLGVFLIYFFNIKSLNEIGKKKVLTDEGEVAVSDTECIEKLEDTSEDTLEYTGEVQTSSYEVHQTEKIHEEGKNSIDDAPLDFEVREETFVATQETEQSNLANATKETSNNEFIPPIPIQKISPIQLVSEETISTPLPVEKEASIIEPEVQRETEIENNTIEFDIPKHTPPKKNIISQPLIFEIEEPVQEAVIPEEEQQEDAEVDFIVESSVEQKPSDVQAIDNYDPTLSLSMYQMPTVDLLINRDPGKVKVTKEELEKNKDKIVETLGYYKIGIQSIKATVGPTVTLYEIIPEVGVKISKIKNLEDDIAMSLAALGIRIIAPIPGKGTIGIEVPNHHKEIVTVRHVFQTEKFMDSDMELPIAFGKTISNEIFMADLAKMPHLLVAGATGQGKSVGINMLIASLLYKKHPAELKFVLVDPKVVELSIYEGIEKHYLAMLPDGEDAILTDTSLVINTLNSLCIEMENRYDLLKKATCRNLAEYNGKFVKRKLNPNNGHKYLPYIVVIIDEYADFIMTAGKEVETPIARLAQKARAIGIHLILATQRPDAKVVTGIIRANFPARLAFKVSSGIDSRVILDAGGAEQLIGRGDMLFSHSSTVTRVQCAFIDTPEVDDMVNFIKNQQGFPSPYMLPEFVDSKEPSLAQATLDDRDALFEDAARIIVGHQQGSTSLVQRKLRIGYNRAGSIIDQLEVAGVVGPFSGSKAREVLVADEMSLEQLLNSLNGL